jgi:hypothetical protein
MPRFHPRDTSIEAKSHPIQMVDCAASRFTKDKQEVTRMVAKLTLAAAFAATLLLSFGASADEHKSGDKNVHMNKGVHVEKHVHVNNDMHSNKNVHIDKVSVGHRYQGGTWYGHKRHYWHNRWYDYGIGPCWLSTPIGFVWTCD